MVENTIINTLKFNIENMEQVMKLAQDFGALSKTSFDASRSANLLSNNITSGALKSAAIVEKQVAAHEKQTAAMKKAAAAAKELEDNQKLAETLMSKTGLSASNLAMSLKRMGLQIKGGKIMAPFNKEMKMTDKLLKDLRKNAVRFNMSLLSVMFAGMALQRASSRAFRSLVTTYQKANEETEGLGKATWHLQAAWEFFKYSIMEALMQSPLFQALIQLALDFVKTLNNMSAEKKSLIGIGIAVIFIIATIMVLLSQIGLAKVGLEGLGISMSGFSGGGFLPLIGKIVFWLLVIYMVFKLIDEILKAVNDTFGTNISGLSILAGLLKIIAFIMKSVVTAFLIGGLVISTGIAVIIAGILGFIDILYKLQKVGEWVCKKIANAIYEYFPGPINWLIDRINNVIDAINAASHYFGGGDIFTRVEAFGPAQLFDTGSFADVISEETWMLNAANRSLDLATNMIGRSIDLYDEMGAYETDFMNNIGSTFSPPESSNNHGTTNIYNEVNVNTQVESSASSVADQINQMQEVISNSTIDKLNELYGMNIGSNNG